MAFRGPLGREIPPDWEHIRKYPIRGAIPTAPSLVQHSIPLHFPWYSVDQQSEGACVGCAWTWRQMMRNHRTYDWLWLYHSAQIADSIPGENYSGTEVRAGGEVLRNIGHRRIFRNKRYPAALAEGISIYRWTGSDPINDMRASIVIDEPVVLGINWYEGFDNPVPGPSFLRQAAQWFPPESQWGQIRGGHALTAFAADDKAYNGLGAFRLVQSWGRHYRPVCLTYPMMRRLILHEQGEAAIAIDR